MKSSTVQEALETFDKIEATSKRTEKAKLLMSLKDNKAAKALILLAMGRDQFYVKPPKLSAVKPYKSIAFKTYGEAYDEFVILTKRLISGEATGNLARNEVECFLYQAKHMRLAQKWFHAVLAKKLRMGVDTSIQKVWPGLIVPFGCAKGIALIEQKTGKIVARAAKMIDFSDIVYSQPKKDGFNITYRCNLMTGKGTAVSSDNMELPVLKPWADAIAKELSNLALERAFDDPNNIIEVNGEAEAVFNPKIDGKKWKSGWGKASALVKLGMKKTGFDASAITEAQYKLLQNDLRITLYDIYPERAHVEEVAIEYHRRYHVIGSIVFNLKQNARKHSEKMPYNINAKCIDVIESVRCKNQKALAQQHNIWFSNGEEGSIVRMDSTPVKADSKWRGNYVKWKEHSKFDCVIVGVEEGNGRNAGRAGAFVCYIPKTKKFTNITVPNDAARAAVWKVKDKIAGWGLEAVQQADTKTSNAATFPTCARFRHDQPPMNLKVLQKIVSDSKGKCKAVIGTKQLDSKGVLAVANACNKTAK